MLSRLLQIPGARKQIWKLWYQHLSGRFPRADWSFMNYGFAQLDPLQPPLELEANDEADRLCIQLYHRVANTGQVLGQDVLEVGSGRGGGASYVCRYLKPKSMVGVDFSANAVALAAKHFANEILRFEQGDAGALPFDSASFDQVINVESSHCYPSRPAFFREVYRVLRDRGRFQFTDLFGVEELAEVRRQLADAGLKVLDETDITPNVVEALVQSHDAKEALIHSEAKGVSASLLRTFAGLKGSQVYDSFREGRLCYVLFSAVKP